MDTKVLPSGDVARTAVLSHPGLDPDKQDNEDVAVTVATPLGLLCLVCDGMGGHENGKLAATTAANEIVQRLTHTTVGEPAQALGNAIREANTKVFALSQNRRLAAGATCVAILIGEKGTAVAHAGDSRAYLVHRGTIAQITRDHSKVRDMVDRGLITPEEARVHPDANQITRALGITEHVDVEVRPALLPHMSGDVYVLCTDGLSDLVDPDEMLAELMQADEPEAAQALVDLALTRGGHDNTTLIIARIQKDASTSAQSQTEIGTPPPPPAVEPGSVRAIPTTERPPVAVTQAAAPVVLAPVPPPRAATTSGWDDTTEAPRAPRSRAVLAAGLALALVAVAILVALYVVVERKHRHVQGPIPHVLPTVSTSASPEGSLHPIGTE
jgi:protein phosphatase